MKRVYVETTIPSYLAAKPSRDLIHAARQQMTHRWWNEERNKYELYLSQIVLDEVAAGDPDAASRRLMFIREIELLGLDQPVNVVANAIMASGLLPVSATRDALHIAVSSIHRMDILVTWNCRHIANAAIMRELAEIVARSGFNLPILCTPEELLGD